MDASNETALARAIAIIGSQKRLADLLGIKPPSVHEWVVKGVPPAERCRAIEAATEGKVTVHHLRPDIFGPPPAPQSAPSAEQAA
jgi:DNA-binding transcriptional regulator YdaS (Cro superfamily)